MERTAINPVSWSIELGFDQAELVQGHRRLLVCSAQDAMDADGNPQHPGDLVAQLELSLDNLEAVLAAADMTFTNVVRLNFFTTDVDALFKQFGRVNERSGIRAMRPPCSASPSYRPSSSSCWRQPQLTNGSVVYESPANVRASASSGGGISGTMRSASGRSVDL